MIGRTINNYNVIKKLGEGGMGVVYLAEQTLLGRKAAIKSLHPEYAVNKEILNRFINEARTLAMLDHQYIVKLYDFFQDKNNFFIVMEYAEGTVMDKYIENVTGPIPEVRAKYLFRKILEAFRYAHSRGVIHRDIKPSNIILTNDDLPKILDFGIAKLLNEGIRITRVNTKMGSVMYMSPEQVKAEDLDQRSDVYSLGVTLFEMVTGRGPYDADNDSLYTIQSKIINHPLPPPSSYYPQISPQMEDIIYKATEKSPAARFQNCDEFIQAIENIDYYYERYNQPLNQIKNYPVVEYNEPEAEIQPVIVQQVEKEPVDPNKLRIDVENAKKKYDEKFNTIKSKNSGEHEKFTEENNKKPIYKNKLFIISGAATFVLIVTLIVLFLMPKATSPPPLPPDDEYRELYLLNNDVKTFIGMLYNENQNAAISDIPGKIDFTYDIEFKGFNGKDNGKMNFNNLKSYFSDNKASYKRLDTAFNLETPVYVIYASENSKDAEYELRLQKLENKHVLLSLSCRNPQPVKDMNGNKNPSGNKGHNNNSKTNDNKDKGDNKNDDKGDIQKDKTDKPPKTGFDDTPYNPDKPK